MARWVPLGTLVVLAAGIGAFTLWWKWVPLHKGDYIRRAERVIAPLPPPPGARSRGLYAEAREGDCTALFCGPQPGDDLPRRRPLAHVVLGVHDVAPHALTASPPTSRSPTSAKAARC